LGVADATVAVLKGQSQSLDINDVVRVGSIEIARCTPNILLGTGGFDD
jgi:hypothetical protein